MERNHEPEDLRVLRLERAKRCNNYISESKGVLRALLGKLEAALDTGASLPARRALEELAQHHTDLENAIEGNG